MASTKSDIPTEVKDGMKATLKQLPEDPKGKLKKTTTKESTVLPTLSDIILEKNEEAAKCNKAS